MSNIDQVKLKAMAAELAKLVSKVTESVLAKVTEWRARPLDECYPIVYLDGISVKVRQDTTKQVVRKTMYVALGINLKGKKECLGLWLSENESSKFWLSVLTEIQSCGVKDILIASVDGLTGFPEAIRKAIYTTNAIESLNSVIRKAVNHRKIFAHDNSAFKVVFMVIEQASKK